MTQTDTRGLPLSLIYVWVTLANGFRFGPPYLIYSLVVSTAGFGIVIWQNSFCARMSNSGSGWASA